MIKLTIAVLEQEEYLNIVIIVASCSGLNDAFSREKARSAAADDGWTKRMSAAVVDQWEKSTLWAFHPTSGSVSASMSTALPR